MTYRLPSLTQLRCFEAAARHQSFTACGEELGMTQSAVSKKIKELETDLGFDLFQRVGRGVALTIAGRNLAGRLARDLTQIQDTLRQATSAGAGKDHISIATLPTFANLWLIPRLPMFSQACPDIELTLATRLDPFEFERTDFDLAVHYGTDNWPGTKMTFLFGEQMIPVCAPGVIDSYNNDAPDRWEKAPLLHLSSRANAWPDWVKKSKIGIRERRDGTYFDQHSMVITAAKAGLGAAIVPSNMVTHELSHGDLVQIPGPELATENGYYLVRPAGQARDAVNKFETWLKAQMEAN
ncbi:LysR substrate-binding domain-containing protein [uncultured Pelagimonas sp.]|uniref:LysR substrate-binding domain-containing protein n=1 Tax=uncultured Pelagimonas sp. TaxID=1618102 RepID=UPI00262032AE|nr:LysR substrate-binding domain-containing protein [uncultured Pelagimonas sp.]